ncbi:hypothetical protein C4D42_14020, partial [Clostridium perfringens]
KKVNEIMILFKHYYKNLAKIILIFGIIVSFALPFFVKNQVNLFFSYACYYLYLINSALSYLFTYKQTLIISDQKQYKIVVVSNVTRIIKSIIQCCMIIFIKSFLLWIIIEVMFNFIGMILVNKKIDFEYKDIIDYKSKNDIKHIKKSNKIIIDNLKNIFIHKIGSFVVFQTDSILITIFSTLKQTAIYANYTMIISSLTGLIANVMGSTMASVGNLIVEESKEKAYHIFKKLYLIDHIIAIFICTVTYNIINQFITFWVGSEYLFSNNIVIVLILNLYIQISRGSIDRFKDGFGIYGDIGAPIVESLTNLIFSIVLANYFGIIGIFIGTIISNIIIIEIWKPYILFKRGFEISILNYIKQTIKI